MKKKYPMKGYPKLADGARSLPVFRGYFVDGRLKQFRSAVFIDPDSDGFDDLPIIEFVSFDSEKGQELISAIFDLAELERENTTSDAPFEEMPMQLLEDELYHGGKNWHPQIDWGPTVGVYRNS
jgi:hypothetical protein